MHCEEDHWHQGTNNHNDVEFFQENKKTSYNTSGNSVESMEKDEEHPCDKSTTKRCKTNLTSFLVKKHIKPYTPRK